ncbi:MAG: ABC transporter ATP-binding protein [Meiothermus sp.]
MNLLHLLRPFWTQILLALGLSLLPAAAQAWLPGTVVKPLFDQVLAGQYGRLGAILWDGAWLLLLLLVGGYAHEAFMGYLSVKIPATLRGKVFDSLLAADLAAVPGSSAGLSGRVLSDLRELENFVFYGLGTMLFQGVTLIALLVQLFLRYTELTLYLLLALPLLALVLGWVGRLVTGYSARTQAALERLAGRMAEGLARLELIRALHLESFARRRFSEANERGYRLGRARALLGALGFPLGQLSTTLLLGLLLVLGVRQVQSGALSTGDLTAFLTLLALAVTPIQTLSRAGVIYAQGEGAARRVQELLDIPPARKSGAFRKDRLEGKIELQTVGFAYSGEETLRGVSFSVNPGSFTALVGPSGSGKSTLLRLLLGLYPPQSGKILLDGKPLSDYNGEWLRHKIAWVPQEPLLFGGTVGENLRALAPHADEKGMLGALARVGLDREISLSTVMNEDGGGLSVGQRQRLAIAAALLRDARVLLLDEITSALDRSSEAQVVASLEAVRPGRTVIVVAHRLSTIRHADQIVVMEAGRVVEVGSHTDLLLHEGLYAELWNAG